MLWMSDGVIEARNGKGESVGVSACTGVWRRGLLLRLPGLRANSDRKMTLRWSRLPISRCRCMRRKLAILACLALDILAQSKIPTPASGPWTAESNGVWRWHGGDDVRWAAPSFDDSKWLDLKTPGPPPQTAGIYWLRLQVRNRRTLQPRSSAWSDRLCIRALLGRKTARQFRPAVYSVVRATLADIPICKF